MGCTSHRLAGYTVLMKIYMTLTILLSIGCLQLIIKIIIGAINLLQLFTGAKDLLMGLTILAVGNSLPDTFVDMALSKAGYEIMATSGLVAGQMFNLLFGFGLSALIKFFR